MKQSLVILVTLLVFSTLVKLGLWQMDRAEQKKQIEQRWESRADQKLSWPLSQPQDLAGYSLDVQGELLREQSLLLDNRVLNGTVGYQWLVPLEVHPSQPWLLLDLGFVTAPQDRTSLPQLPKLPDRLDAKGVLYSIYPNPFNLQLLPEIGAVTRIQSINIKQLEQLWQHQLTPQVLMLSPEIPIGYAREYQVINISPHKHTAYALQWFGLATAWAVISLVVLFRSRLQPKVNRDNLRQNNNV